ncbi:MAG TPA: hypothetical protein VIL23_02440 [Clostridia bacterium]
MKKLLTISLTLLIALTIIVNFNNLVLADGMEQEQPKDLYISYFEYTIYNEDGNIIKSLKKGRIVVTKDSDENRGDAPEIEIEIELPEKEIDKKSNEKDFRIYDIKENAQKPNGKKPRPIIPLIETYEA